MRKKVRCVTTGLLGACLDALVMAALIGMKKVVQLVERGFRKGKRSL